MVSTKGGLAAYGEVAASFSRFSKMRIAFVRSLLAFSIWFIDLKQNEMLIKMIPI